MFINDAAIAQEMYSRQTMIKEIGQEGQQKLKRASVLVVGCGGLGAPVLYYLTAMGIGHLGLCDGDKVSLSNLNRQVLFTADDLNKPKASTASKRILALNPNLKTTIYEQYLDDKLAKKIIPAYDIIVDCLDNFATRFIVNDACIVAGKPFIHAGVEEFCGQMMTIIPGKGPCLRCLFPNGVKEKEDKKEKKPTGIIGPTPGVIGSIQALEAVKYLLDLPTYNEGLIIYNGLELTMEKVTLNISQGCICRKK
ncbi:MAG: HesA/MoeB/ThiF family protein [Oscillospiraceae bacterium]|jgi:adenylyltransferase/sulfurtransferase|nr:HesA/MoeB/ThiF family protein [Oscillospiraceae bacterium]